MFDHLPDATALRRHTRVQSLLDWRGGAGVLPLAAGREIPPVPDIAATRSRFHCPWTITVLTVSGVE